MKKSTVKKSPVKKTLRIAIILSKFNEELATELSENTIKQLKKLGVKKINLYHVPGALELPFAALKVAKKEQHDAIIALGIVMRGETKHFDLVCEQTYAGLMEINTDEETPVIFGVLAVENRKQALDRIRADKMNKGAEFAQAAVEMAQFKG